MAYDPRFGPATQTPAQRAFVLEQRQGLMASLKQFPSAHVQQLYRR